MSQTMIHMNLNLMKRTRMMNRHHADVPVEMNNMTCHRADALVISTHRNNFPAGALVITNNTDHPRLGHLLTGGHATPAIMTMKMIMSHHVGVSAVNDVVSGQH